MGRNPKDPSAVWCRLAVSPGEMGGGRYRVPGHLLAEDAPEETPEAISRFLTEG